VAHDVGALLIVDAVATLGGVELRVDDWDIDVCFSTTQKCLGCPPGLAPITLSQRAIDTMSKRQVPVSSFYLNVGLLGNYFRKNAYHHTAPISMVYALREALRLILEEGLEQRWHRHSACAIGLAAGIEAMGLEMFATEGYRLPSLTTVRVPDGVDSVAVRRFLLDEHDIEIVGGLGDLATSIWRIGLMGHNSTPRNVVTFLAAFEDALLAQGFEFPAGASLTAARDRLRGPSASWAIGDGEKTGTAERRERWSNE
jgi:alanine-glyoxylate transaminase/serine-glyoxylate transaminase/serine-pyruvate transaminase